MQTKTYKVIFTTVLLLIYLNGFCQNSIEVLLPYIPENLPTTGSWLSPGDLKIIGDADLSKNDFLKNIRNPKIMEVKLGGIEKFKFAVGFDKIGNKWIIPYDFDKYQPYANIPFIFNENCTQETIYLRLPNFKQLKGYTLKRYYFEEKDKNGIGKSTYGKMLFDVAFFGHYASNFKLENTKYNVMFWGYDFVLIQDTLGNDLVRRSLNIQGRIITLNDKKYAIDIIDKYKSPRFRIEPLTDSLLAKNKDLLTTTDFAKFGITNLDDKKISPIKDLVAKNDYTLVDFWGTWCGPCIAELPSLAEAYSQYKDKLPFISVAFDSDLEKIKPLMEKNGIVWQQYYLSKAQEKAQAEKYSINSFPTFMLIDKKGQVIYRSDRDDDKTTPLHKDKLLKMLKKYFP